MVYILWSIGDSYSLYYDIDPCDYYDIPHMLHVCNMCQHLITQITQMYVLRFSIHGAYGYNYNVGIPLKRPTKSCSYGRNTSYKYQQVTPFMVYV
jgi:hypothetical protein